MTPNEHVYAIYCQPEVADDVISGEDAETFQKYVYINVSVAILQQFARKSNFCNA